MKVGVLALQGDFAAHARALRSAGADPFEVRTPAELREAAGLVIPGGESTTLRILGGTVGMLEPLRDAARAGLPILGTCAGMIACAGSIADGDEPIIGHLDITVRRNAYGRQVASFEADVEVDGIGTMRAVFIRAPRIERVGDGVVTMARLRDEPVAVRAGASIFTAFHPELTDDDRLHAAFVEGL